MCGWVGECISCWLRGWVSRLVGEWVGRLVDRCYYVVSLGIKDCMTDWRSTQIESNDRNILKQCTFKLFVTTHLHLNLNLQQVRVEREQLPPKVRLDCGL